MFVGKGAENAILLFRKAHGYPHTGIHWSRGHMLLIKPLQTSAV